MKSPTAIRTGVASSVLVTGVLFGLLHAPQLGFTLGFVALLTLVGVIFTFVRAWTGTVLASFLLHLGYNSFIAVTSIITTRGFTHLPPVH
jgi:membrane protease YdiL (CAAX protease family)